MLANNQRTLFSTPTKFKVGDRVKLLLYEDSDFYGTVESVSNKGSNSDYLVEDDDGFSSWDEEKWLEKSDVPKGVNYGGCVLYPDGHIVNNFKDRFTKDDLPELEKSAKELEASGCTGHHYSVVCSCISALKGEKPPEWLSEREVAEGRGVATTLGRSGAEKPVMNPASPENIEKDLEVIRNEPYLWDMRCWNKLKDGQEINEWLDNECQPNNCGHAVGVIQKLLKEGRIGEVVKAMIENDNITYKHRLVRCFSNPEDCPEFREHKNYSDCGCDMCG
jgi:hypothetical protein